MLTHLDAAFQYGFQLLNTLLFPPRCAGCGKVDYYFCPQCIQDIRPVSKHMHLEHITAFCTLGKHQDPLRKAIHDLKYNNQRELGAVLGKLLLERIFAEDWSFDIIIPVPLHPARFLKRGYNQAKELLNAANSSLESAVLTNVLYRSKETPPQVGQNAQARINNVQDAFAVSPQNNPLIHNKNILLIDDVCTTGATLSACAHVLKSSGASHVYAATVSQASNIEDDR